jgi:bisphosphoglycerate-dependent phosphoglycerate mutase
MSVVIQKKFYFVRHGTTDWNIQQLCQGHTDIKLNELGRMEALELGKLQIFLFLPFIPALSREL